MTTKANGLSQHDLELIERVIYKQGDDIAVSIARSFERLEERIDAAESRLHGRIAEFEDRGQEQWQNAAEEFGAIRIELRELAKAEAALDPL